jgi:hypothetical protein
MKNLKLTLISFLIASFAALPAKALEARGPYVGIGYENSEAEYEDNSAGDVYGDNFNNINIFGGYYFNDYLGAELSYTRSDKSDDSVTSGAFETFGTLRYSKYDANLLYNHNLIEGDFGIDLVALVGGSYIHYDRSTSLKFNGSNIAYEEGVSDQFGVNAGLGLELPITREFSVRALAKYTQFFDNSKLFDKMMSYNLGVKYSF